jgi:TM2 domain-containing membrane protein YozV
MCISCGAGLPSTIAPLADISTRKLVAGLCGIFLGGFGIHKFILGNNKPGIIMAAISVCTAMIGYPLMHVIGLIEGIIYLTKSDAEFYQLYVVQKKEWF